MMKLRRRPLSVHNASLNRVSDQPSRKRQRKVSNESLSDHERNDSDTENQSPTGKFDGEIDRFLKLFFRKCFLDSDDDDRNSGIQSQSIVAAKNKSNQSSDDGMLVFLLN